MGKLAEFSIVLQGNRMVFYPGEQLMGEVILNLYQPMDMKAIKIEAQGKGYCHWTEKHREGEEEKTDHFSNEEKYFEYEIRLFGNHPKQSHPTGRYSYPFTFTLPKDLPSSLEASYGHIRYELKAEIIKPWKFNHKVKRPFTINEIIDVNLPMYSRGPGGEEHKEVGCLCCLAGPLDVSAHIGRGAYCPGEVILINSQVQNHTTRDMSSMKAKLIKNIDYHSTKKTKSIQKEVAKLTGPAIPKGEFATWSHEPFGIPATPPTIKNSRVISVSYVLYVEISVPWGLDLRVKMPITIGTVPFRETYGESYQLPAEQMGPQANFGTAPYAPPPTGLIVYPHMAPPSYAAAVGETLTNIKGDHDQHTHGNLAYMPVYTFAQPYKGTLPTPETTPQYPPQLPQGTYPPPAQGGYPQPPQGGYPQPPQPSQGGFPQLQQGGYPQPTHGGYPQPTNEAGYPPASGYPSAPYPTAQ